jgi:hypothetical protein
MIFGISAGSARAACAPDAVQTGPVCVDKFENSLWDLSAVPTAGKTRAKLISSIQAGTVTLSSLVGAGAVQLGLTGGDLAASGCPLNGAGCLDVYAVSIAGVTPSRNMSWFQAAAAARNSLKRLPSNAEWQVAALGTPDTGGADDGVATCNTDDLDPSLMSHTGARGACVSDAGAFDMAGNVWEWVADWTPRSTVCPGGSWLTFSDDLQCFLGAAVSGPPGALIRGGSWSLGATAGIFALSATADPSIVRNHVGFRSAR